MTAVPDYFALFDMPPTLSPDAAALRSAYYRLSRQHHPDRFAGSDAEAQIEALRASSQVNEGYRILAHPDALLGYILKLHGVMEDEESYRLPPAFLMEIMELNEAVGNAAMAPDMHAEALREFDAVMTGWTAAVTPLTTRYNAGERTPELLAALKDFYYRKKYLLRIQERLN